MDSTSTTDKKTGKGGIDNRIKLIFVLIAIAGIVGIQLLQRSGQVLPDWDEDLDSALSQARQEKRKVLVLFSDHPPGQITLWLASGTIPKNELAIREGNFLPVLIRLGSLDDPLAKKYKIKSLPTMLILSSRDRELNRREGKIGEVPFRDEFLSLRKVVRPGK